MAITLIDTVGAANANTYLLKNAADALVEGFVKSDDVIAWGNATDDDKDRALYSATQRIDRERFLGSRASDTQALEWPRQGVRKPDTFTHLYGVSFPNRLMADYYGDDEIPDKVKNATTRLAVYLNNNPNGLELSGLEDFSQVEVGSLKVTPRFYGAVGIDRIPPIVDAYLIGIRIGGRANLSLKRS